MIKIKTKTSDFRSNLFIFSMAFYYALGALWYSSLLTSGQVHILWIASIFVITVSYFFMTGFKLHLPKKPKMFQVCVLIFILFALVSVLWATNRSKAFSRGWYVLRIILSMIFISLLLNSEGDIRRLLKSMEYGGYIAVIFLIIRTGFTYMISMFRGGSRLFYTGVNPNTIGLIAAFSLIICVYFIRTEGFRLTSLVSLSCVFIIVLSVSKKAMFASALGILFFIILSNIGNKKSVKSILRIAGISLAAIILAYFILQLPFMEALNTRLQGMFSGLSGDTSDIDFSTSQRLYLRQSGYDLIKKHPIIGVGLDNARFYNIYELYLHDNFLELFADLGIFGVLIYYFMYAVNAVRFIRLRDFTDPEFNICFVFLVIMLFLDYGRVSYYNLSTYFMLLLFFLKSDLMIKKRRSAYSYSPERGSGILNGKAYGAVLSETE